MKTTEELYEEFRDHYDKSESQTKALFAIALAVLNVGWEIEFSAPDTSDLMYLKDILKTIRGIRDGV